MRSAPAAEVAPAGRLGPRGATIEPDAGRIVWKGSEDSSRTIGTPPGPTGRGGQPSGQSETGQPGEVNLMEPHVAPPAHRTGARKRRTRRIALIVVAACLAALVA